MTIVLLKSGISVDKFDCGDADLNEFIRKDAFEYGKKHLAQTYVALYNNEPIAFISICMDCIRLSDEEKVDEFGQNKTHPDFPALKIARLGTAKSYQDKGVGKFLVRYIIGKAIELSDNVGCRFVTVDANPNERTIKFYADLQFIRNQKDHSGENVSMRLDLIQHHMLEQKA